MRAYLTHHEIANIARMTRGFFSGAIIIVEGDTDLRVYERVVNKSYCVLIPAHGKKNAIEALTLLERDNFKGILSIVDADFWKLNGINPASINTFLTDTHDLETMILSSGALEKVLSEFGSSSKIGRRKKQIRDSLLECALPIGYLRWISSPTKDNLSLNFKELRFIKFVDKKRLIVDIIKLIKEVKNKSRNYSLNDSEVKLKIQELAKSGYDPWQVCSGGDMIQILTFGIKNSFGKKEAKTIKSALIDAILRVSYESSYFYSTKLYYSLKSWEEANPNFKIFHD